MTEYERYLTLEKDLLLQKQNMVDILTSVGVDASNEETLNTLVPKFVEYINGTASKLGVNALLANVIKQNVGGESIRCDDVSSIEHDLSLNVSSKNLFDINRDNHSKGLAVNFVSLTDGELVIKQNGNPIYSSYNIAIPNAKNLVGKTITVSCDCKVGDGGNNATVRVLWLQSNGGGSAGTDILYKPYVSSTEYQHISVSGVVNSQPTETHDTLALLFYANVSATLTNEEYYSYFKNVQIELGSTATEYTPYISDFSGVSVSRYGKNLFDISQITNATYLTNNGDGTLTAILYPSPTSQTLQDVCPTLKAGDVITLSLVSDSHIKAIYIGGDAKITWYINKPLTVTEAMLNGMIHFYCCRTDGVNSPATISNIQIELGASATDYKSYAKPQTATANADGIVSGLTSISPNMTIMSDTDGVIVDCIYNTDTKTYIDNEFAKVESLLLEV